jgi:excisionase family DNA binding protein
MRMKHKPTRFLALRQTTPHNAALGTSYAEGRNVNAETVTLEPERLLGPKQVASYLGVPVTTLYVWRHRGVGPAAFRVGRHLRYRREDVEAWLQGQGPRPAA